jgi:hypothetical protein
MPLTLHQDLLVRNYELGLEQCTDIDVIRQSALASYRLNIETHNYYQQNVSQAPSYVTWKDINSSQLRNAIIYYKRWLFTRKISLNPIKHMEMTCVLKVYFVEFLEKDYWSETIAIFRKESTKIGNMYDIASLHQSLQEKGIDPIF